MILMFEAYSAILPIRTETMGVYPSCTYLSLFHEIPLETTEEDFPLAGLQSIHHGGDRSRKIRHREKDKLLVHKITVFDLVRSHVQKRTRLPSVARKYIRFFEW